MPSLTLTFSNTTDFASWDELAAARERLLTEGWTCVPYDSPDLGIRAFAAYSGSAEWSRENEAPVLLRWAIFGRPLLPTLRILTSWQALVRELDFRRAEDLEKSDDPRQFQVGFVSYAKAGEGKSEVFRIGHLDLQAGGAEARKALVEVLSKTKYGEETAALLAGASKAPPPTASGGR